MNDGREMDTAPIFVGRLTELAELRRGLDRALGGRGAIFLLTGEPGIGKTRLAEELARVAAGSGARVLWGRASQAEGMPPHWPWAQVLRSLVRELGREEVGRLAGPGLAQVLKLVPDLRGQLPDAPRPSGEEDGTRAWAYDCVAQLLVAAAAQRPTVVVLEDLHWAERSSLVLLRQVADWLPSSRLLLVGTYRDRELPADHPLAHALADFVRAGDTVAIPLGGVSDAEAGALLRAFTGFEPAPDLVRRLQLQTGGSPLFLRELARVLSEENPSAAGAIPRGVDAVLRRRIDGLSTACRRALAVAALAGQDVQVDLVELATATDRQALLGLLDEAVEQGVLRRSGTDFAFSHGLFRDAIAGALTTSERARMHGLIGSTLEARALPDEDVPAAALAHHFAGAAVVDASLRVKARAYVVAAARQALAELAYEEAARLLDAALGALGPLAPGERGQLLLDLGRARYLAGEVGPALAAASEASRLGERIGEADLVTRAALVLRGVGGPDVSEAVKELCDAALRQAPADRSLRIQLLGQLAVVLMQTPWVGDETAAAERSRQALELAGEATDPDVVFAAIHARQMARSGPDGVAERLQLAERTLGLARDADRPALAQWGHEWRAEALVQLGRIDEAEAEVERLARVAARLREPLPRWRALVAHSELALLRGRFVDAGTLSEEAWRLGRKCLPVVADFVHAFQRLKLLRFVDDGAAAVGLLQAHARAHPEMQVPIGVAVIPELVAEGRVEEARVGLRPFTRGPGSIRPLMSWLPAMASVTDAVSALGEREAAAAAYEALLPYAGQNVVSGAGMSGVVGAVAHYLGMLAAVMERWDDADRHYEEAVAFQGRMGAPPFVARSRILQAEALARRGRSTDLRRARELAEAGRAASRELGMRPWQERAEALAGQGVDDHPLSRRELEVALLVSDGLSNRAIAERLHLSERTAESHVKNICDKLGFNSRSQVAAWVAHRGGRRQ